MRQVVLLSIMATLIPSAAATALDTRLTNDTQAMPAIYSAAVLKQLSCIAAYSPQTERSACDKPLARRPRRGIQVPQRG